MTAATAPELAPWLPTRDEALRRLAAFVPHAGREYAAKRNFDLGPGHHENVSRLSPYVRARLVTEPEILRAVLAAHSTSAADKFISEVFWRTYWKGWLEARPAVWHDYLASIDERRAEIDAVPARRKALAAAEAGETGIAPFDAWARELAQTGYIHNHARMWFASLWIFTLKLPWELGADFFMRHLLCGDPASNTLSWRWVGGFHTRGKTYLARPGNIERYTEGRFDPAGVLATRAPALEGPDYPVERTAVVPLDPVTGPMILLLHEDDVSVESLPLDDADVRSTIGLVAANGRSPAGLAAGAYDFARSAVVDGVGRAPRGDAAVILDASDLDAVVRTLVQRAHAADVTTIATPFAPVGPVHDALEAIRTRLADDDIALREIGRNFDALAYPHGTRGFFTLRGKIPKLLKELGITTESAASPTA